MAGRGDTIPVMVRGKWIEVDREEHNRQVSTDLISGCVTEMATGTKRWRDEVEVPADMVIGHNATNVAMLLNNHTGNVDSAERYEPRLTKRGKAVTAAHVQAARAALDEIEAELPERIRRLAAKSERELAKARVVLDSIEATLKRRNIL